MADQAGDRARLGWLLPALAVAALPRLALLALPGPGRDEAAYHYWSHHPEPAYAPLLQALLRLADLLPLPAVLSLRLPSLLAGVSALLLLHLWMRDRGASPAARAAAVATLALGAWGAYAGAIAHPDMLLLVAALAFVVATGRQRSWLAVLAAAAALAAKPSGLVVVLVAFAWLGRDRPPSRGPATLLLAALVAPVLLPLLAQPELVAGMLDFARMGQGRAPWQGLVAGAVGLLFLLGPLPLVAGARGLRAWRRPLDPATACALLWLLAFGLAAGAGQWKANWVAPALFLLWPAGWEPSRRTLAVGLVATALPALVLATSLSRPGWTAAVEARIPAGPLAYPALAGEREAERSVARSWSQRAREYQRPVVFADSLRARYAWPPAAIVADDYGLAARLHFELGEPGVGLWLPGDPVFRPRDGQPLPAGRPLLVLGAHGWPKLPPGTIVEGRSTLPHPLGGRTVQLGWIDDPEPDPR